MTSAPTITIVETCPYHLRDMAIAMTQDSAEVSRCHGMTPLKALWQSYRKSIICRTALIDGKVAAIWGVYGVLFADTGEPWLIVAPSVEDYPFRTAFIYKKELQKMQEMFPVLEEYVPANNEKSIRLLELMGFKVSKNKVAVAGMEYRRAERRA